LLFTSSEYFLFLPFIFILYWNVFNKSLKWQNLLVLAASYFFYGWWSWKFLCLLALITFLDYLYGFGVASASKKKAKFFLWLSIINNLAILGIFKYYDFFAVQFAKGFEALGLHSNLVMLNVALPIGISFYTFHGMSYVFDIYRDKQKPVSNIVDYAVFVSFFPLLVAGPIERANHLLPQVQKPRNFNYNQAVEGCRLILWGLFKKVVIADSLAVIVDNIFEHYIEYDGLSLMCGAIAFSFQIYGDFSGYTDIALGTAKLFGFELLSNFKFPYFSRDIAEFWRRWHISLSSWFKDYLYIPLGGSKEGKLKAVRNTFIIFIVSGFWHGANWNFIAWGFIHACGFLPLLLLNRNRKHITNVVAENKLLPSIKDLWQMFSTFTFVTLAWIFFRADSVSHAFYYIKSMISGLINFNSHFNLKKIQINSFYYIIFFIIFDWLLRKNERKLSLPDKKSIRLFIYLLFTFLIVIHVAIRKNSDTFIYFQF
jgi:alginate O-acetyltransferase complex protein AlgI